MPIMLVMHDLSLTQMDVIYKGYGTTHVQIERPCIMRCVVSVSRLKSGEKKSPLLHKMEVEPVYCC